MSTPMTELDDRFSDPGAAATAVLPTPTQARHVNVAARLF